MYESEMEGKGRYMTWKLLTQDMNYFEIEMYYNKEDEPSILSSIVTWLLHIVFVTRKSYADWKTKKNTDVFAWYSNWYETKQQTSYTSFS